MYALRYGDRTGTEDEGKCLRISNDWLRRNNLEIYNLHADLNQEFKSLYHTTSTLSSTSVSIAKFSPLNFDLNIVVSESFDEVGYQASYFLKKGVLEAHGFHSDSLIIILDRSLTDSSNLSSQPLAEEVRNKLDRKVGARSVPRVLNLDSTKALRALKSFSDPKKNFNQTLNDDLSRSGLVELRQTILTSINPLSKSSNVSDSSNDLDRHHREESMIEPIRTRTRVLALEVLIEIYLSGILKLNDQIQEAESKFFEFKSNLSKFYEKIQQVLTLLNDVNLRENNIISTSPSSAFSSNDIYSKEEFRLNGKFLVKRLLEKELSWYKLLFLNNDLVGSKIYKTIDKFDLLKIEKQLIFRTGRLKELLVQLDQVLTTSLQELPIQTESEQQLLTRRRSIKDLIRIDSLTDPIENRRLQMNCVGGPIEKFLNRLNELKLMLMFSSLGSLTIILTSAVNRTPHISFNNDALDHNLLERSINDGVFGWGDGLLGKFNERKEQVKYFLKEKIFKGILKIDSSRDDENQERIKICIFDGYDVNPGNDDCKFKERERNESGINNNSSKEEDFEFLRRDKEYRDYILREIIKIQKKYRS
ncbi:hypothetical protein BY996DRAFT_6415432 [Phakopsora pachyrhizi]|nr:hypothetical protein BY996DRAFT_6415432 [Phakopsora pachyrhizi]